MSTPRASRSTWVFASTSRGKLAEARLALRACGIELVDQGTLGVAPAPETGLSFVENALLKARHAAELTRLPAIADDSGLCVAGLGGAPGLHSARYAGADASDGANIAKLLAKLAGSPAAARDAQFVCAVVALRAPDDPDPLVATGHWSGTITTAPRGERGFGYDPVFFVPDEGCTAAELDPERKNTLSHRGRAFASVCARFEAWRRAWR